MAFDPTQTYGVIADTQPPIWIQNGVMYNSKTYAVVASANNFNGPPASAFVATTNSSNLINFDPKNFKNFRAAYAKMRRGTLDPLVLMMGDSTMAGYNGSNYIATKTTATPRFLGQLLTSYGIPASEETCNIGGQAAQLFSWDPRITGSTNWTLAGGAAVGTLGQLFSSSVNGATFSFAPTRAFDSFDIFHTTQAAGVITVNVDGGATLATITNPGTFTVVKDTVSCTLGTHTINLVQSGTTFLAVNAIVPHTSTARQLNIVNAGNGGYLASTYNNNTNFYLSGVQTPWTVAAPALTIFELTMNDSTAPTSIATYTANMQALITLAQTAGSDVILSTGNPVNDATGIANIGNLITALQSLAILNGCGFVEMNARRYISYANWNAVVPYSDNYHPSDVTSMDKAEVYAQAIRLAIGAGNFSG